MPVETHWNETNVRCSDLVGFSKSNWRTDCTHDTNRSINEFSAEVRYDGRNPGTPHIFLNSLSQPSQHQRNNDKEIIVRNTTTKNFSKYFGKRAIFKSIGENYGNCRETKIIKQLPYYMSMYIRTYQERTTLSCVRVSHVANLGHKWTVSVVLLLSDNWKQSAILVHIHCWPGPLCSRTSFSRLRLPI